MVAYRYDGSFDGFLCCVFESYIRREVPVQILPEEEAQVSLYPEKWIGTDPDRAERVYTSLSRKISPEARELVETGFLTCLPERERLLYRFIRMGYRHGAQVTSWLADDTVSTLRKAAFSAGHEAHLLTGFLRFSEQNGTLAAIITPKNRVLPLILEHFSSRFNAETFLIYDKTHHMALIHRPGQDAIIPMEHFSLEEPDETERQFRALWKQFYHTSPGESPLPHDPYAQTLLGKYDRIPGARPSQRQTAGGCPLLLHEQGAPLLIFPNLSGKGLHRLPACGSMRKKTGKVDVYDRSALSAPVGTGIPQCRRCCF